MARSTFDIFCCPSARTSAWPKGFLFTSAYKQEWRRKPLVRRLYSTKTLYNDVIAQSQAVAGVLSPRNGQCVFRRVLPNRLLWPLRSACLYSFYLQSRQIYHRFTTVFFFYVHTTTTRKYKQRRLKRQSPKIRAAVLSIAKVLVYHH